MHSGRGFGRIGFLHEQHMYCSGVLEQIFVTNVSLTKSSEYKMYHKNRLS